MSKKTSEIKIKKPWDNDDADLHRDINRYRKIHKKKIRKMVHCEYLEIDRYLMNYDEFLVGEGAKRIIDFGSSNELPLFNSFFNSSCGKRFSLQYWGINFDIANTSNECPACEKKLSLKLAEGWKSGLDYEFVVIRHSGLMAVGRIMKNNSEKTTKNITS